MTTTRLTPLFILLAILLILSIIGYITYSIVRDVTRNTRTKMEAKNVVFSRDGMKVGVKDLEDEEYRDRSQSVLVSMWNHTAFPAYKSRIWNMTKPTNWSEEEQKSRFWEVAGDVADVAGNVSAGVSGRLAGWMGGRGWEEGLVLWRERGRRISK
ncbi:hypothetical protein BO94DRAFT_465451 [Aspergillus sclerotioniger CBS 115572]|uniref:Uncharacterized protein n=1 Tax=Aspergillus sclerotioniger CBS 115572 TaxID=1450535 RepID=A0A317WRE5_9EURO|nr:hypothetical protein BO94DRAFT_465451 [Aspergillus sclerotioniger CBS 115572]PWY87862.1 hypothetical protein BO94DRAFT_465451 [Aspergillus sclerotioniger CBS 115572]